VAPRYDSPRGSIETDAVGTSIDALDPLDPGASSLNNMKFKRRRSTRRFSLSLDGIKVERDLLLPAQEEGGNENSRFGSRRGGSVRGGSIGGSVGGGSVRREQWWEEGEVEEEKEKEKALPWFYKTFPVTTVKITTASLMFGNHALPTFSVVTCSSTQVDHDPHILSGRSSPLSFPALPCPFPTVTQPCLLYSFTDVFRCYTRRSCWRIRARLTSW
jgi:hypothetical protein